MAGRSHTVRRSGRRWLAVVVAGALLVIAAAPLWAQEFIKGARLDNVGAIAMIDVQTAQHHFLFGLLLTVGPALSAVL